MILRKTLSHNLTGTILCTTGLVAACTQQEEPVAIATPAAVYCEETGGQHINRDGKSGQIGICILPDGSEVVAWDYYRNTNPA